MLQVLTAHQKFRTASIIAIDLAAFVSKTPMRHFDVCLQQLLVLYSTWKAAENGAVIDNENADDGAAEYVMAWEEPQEPTNMRQNARDWNEVFVVSNGVTMSSV